jgi:hypothetical protein
MALKDLMDSFRGIAPAQQPAPQPAANPADLGMPTNPMGANPTVPANQPVVTSEPKPEPIPLDQFSKMWETPKVPEGEEAPTSMFANLDPAKLREAAGTVDFTKALTPELLARINAGGPEAQAAVLEAMNKTAQATYAQSALATTKIVEQAVAKAEESFAKKVPGLLKSQNLSESLIKENPALSHAAAQPIIKAIEKQLAVTYPNATTDELTKHAKDYLAGFAEIAAGKPPVVETPQVKPAEDWSRFE